jgi:two-component system, NtrC family, response regulator AtoC
MNSEPSSGTSGPITHGAQDLPWASAIMHTLEKDMACAVEVDAKVMISGESGAGKKSVARLIHERSRRGSAPFVIANCEDIAESLPQSRPDSESAQPSRHGLLTTADSGTLLIEEIQNIPVPIQTQLLQFIESEMASGSDLRLMTATSTDVFEGVLSDQFRNDLFYRLNVIHLIVPPLRERPEDIPILFQHYLSFCARAEVPQLSTAAWDRLVAYHWPGNVRELKAVAETLALQDLPRLVEPDDLPPHIGQWAGTQQPERRN